MGKILFFELRPSAYLLSSLFLFTNLAAIQQKPSDNNCGESLKRPIRITARHIESNGIGYNEGYTTLEGFFSPIHRGSMVPFLDLRGHVFNNGKLAANGGVGARYVTCSRIYGINAYYDYRNTKRQHYNQISLGLETLGKFWDFRINGYLPLGRKASPFYHTEFVAFEGNSLLISQRQEFVLKGANAEFGFHVDRIKNFPFYFAAGPYYLTGKGRSTWGGQARVVLDIFDYLSLEGNTSYDSLFRWVGQGQVSVHIPLGAKRKIKSCKSHSCSTALALSARAVQSVDRNEIIPVDRKKVKSAAINRLTGDPFIIFFVDNTSHSAGTYESPFPTLLAAQNASGPNDIIYIFPGDQTTTGMDAGITLQHGQRLWGSTVEHFLATTAGTITIPPLSTGPFINNFFGTSIALLPIITGPSDVVTVANNNEIEGLYILNSSGNGIVGNGVSNLAVLHNTIQGSNLGSVNQAFSFADISGTLVINNNSISTISPDNAITIANPTANLDVTIANNQILGGADAVSWTVSNQGTLQLLNNNIMNEFNALNITANSNSLFNATISNNQMEMFQSAVLLAANGADITMNINGNFIDGGGSATAIQMTQTTGSLAANVANNQILNYGPGFLLNAGGTAATVVLQSNVIFPGSGNPSTALAMQIAQTSGSLIAQVNGNQTVSGSGAFLLNAGGTSALLTADSNNITSYFGNGIDIQHTAGTAIAAISNNQIATQDNYGFSYTNSIDPTVSAVLQITDNNMRGFEPIFVSQTLGTVAATIDNNTLAGNFDGPGITLILNAPAGTQTATISNNIVTQTDGDGFDFFFYAGGNAVWNINANQFYAIPANAIRMSTNSTPGVDASICASLTNNIAYPIQFNGQGTYLFDNTGNSGTFTLNPPTGNIGDITTSGGVVIGSCP